MLFSVQKEKLNTTGHIPFLLLIILIIGFVLFSNQMTKTNSAHNKEVVEKALSRSITQCYALEGMYPPNLDYLKEHYGLVYDSDIYFIDYQYIGSNLRPDVTIIERD